MILLKKKLIKTFTNKIKQPNITNYKKINKSTK